MLKREQTVIATKEQTNEYGVVIKNEVVRVEVNYGQYKEVEEFIWYITVGNGFPSVNFKCKTERRMRKEMGNHFA